MTHDEIKKLIPLYIENELEPNEMKEVASFLDKNPELKDYARQLQQSWDILGDIDEVQPSESYISNFWTKLSLEKSPLEKFLSRASDLFKIQKFKPVYAMMCVIVLVSVFSLKLNKNANNAQTVEIAKLSVEEIEIFENYELAENLEIIEDIEFLEDLEVIEELEEFEISYAT